VAGEKKSFVIRINDSLYKDLEKWASDEFRSVNGQIEYILTQEVKKRKKSAKKDMDE
jgi:hypothetical protein